MKIGLLGFASNSGLGTLTREFFDNLPIEKTLIIPSKYQDFPDRFPAARIGLTQENVDWFLDGIDVLLSFETPKEWAIFQLARKRGVKTVLMPMYECMPQPLPVVPTAVLCPSLLDQRIFSSELRGKCIVQHIPVPVNRNRVKYRQRSTANVFEFHGGHGGLYGRNGLTDLLAAIPMVQSDAKFLIYSQKQLAFEHPKVEVRVGNYEDYWDIWGEGDVFIFPHRFDGLSLPIQEALSSGMPVLATAFYPFTKMLPMDWLFQPEESTKLRVFQREIDVFFPSPTEIATKIDEWAGTKIAADSAHADDIAEKISWDNLRKSYLDFFETVCNTQS